MDISSYETLQGTVFRDRDAPITKSGLIFRVYGYNHPSRSCFCDLEYAPSSLYSVETMKALREGPEGRFYKFYLDGGLKFASSQKPPYLIFHRPLQKLVVGVKVSQISRMISPELRLLELLKISGDPLIEAMRNILGIVTDNSNLRIDDFGVFGSLAHGFHSVRYSDVDLIIYGKKKLVELRATLQNLFDDSIMENEFDDWSMNDPPHHWNFTRYLKTEYGSYQRRKLIYARYRSQNLGRHVNVEFEPVRNLNEVKNEYDNIDKIESMGRVEARGDVLDDEEGGFMPSIYPIQISDINVNINKHSIRRIVSYVKEFRLQLKAGETALIRGNLEKIVTKDEEFHQITLSYGLDYFDQVLKVVE
jgi:predicted nucleotidyltransferase